MLGRKWAPAEATVVEARAWSAPDLLHEYVVDVPKPKGGLQRATVSLGGRFVYHVGATIQVEINFKTCEAKIDKVAMSRMAQELLRTGQSPDATWVAGSFAAKQTDASGAGPATPPPRHVGAQVNEMTAGQVRPTGSLDPRTAPSTFDPIGRSRPAVTKRLSSNGSPPCSNCSTRAFSASQSFRLSGRRSLARSDARTANRTATYLDVPGRALRPRWLPPLPSSAT